MPRRFPVFAASLLIPGCCLAPLTIAAQAQENPAPNEAPPRPGAENAVILSIRGDRITLNVGSARGAQVGAVYGVLREGKVSVSLRLIEVTADRSIALLLDNDPAARFAVGDSVQFIANGPATPRTPVATPPVAVPAPVPTPLAPINPIAPGENLPNAATSNGANANGALPISVAPLRSALITAVADDLVTLNFGALQGLRLGANLPLLRGGNAVGMVRVQNVAPDSSQARVIWKDENIAVVLTGDSVEIPSGALISPNNPPIIAQNGAGNGLDPNAGFRVVKGSKDELAPIPTAGLRYETGASNLGVPRTERTYELLAALAASGAITRYPASVFTDEGARYHRTAEDSTFTRAQIADLVREALQSQGADDFSSRDRLILGELARDFAPELRQLGVDTPTLTAFAPRGKFQIGVSGQQRLSLVAGDKNDFLVPFSERQGGGRTRSGLDTRTNLFGRVGNRATFFATFDAGTSPGDRRGGLGDSDDQKFQTRRALLSYDASAVTPRLRGLTLEAGRNEVWLGPGHFGTLLLGDTAGPLNQVGYRFQRGALSVRGLYAPLDNGPARTGGRSLYVRDTRFQIGSQAMIGFSESVFVPRDRLDPALLATVFSPVPLFITQRRGKSDSSETSNLLQSFYAEVGVARGLRAYGELLVDDIGVNNENLALNRVGSLLGGQLFTPRDPEKLGIYGEFASLEGRSYLRYGNFDPDYDYFYRSRPLGYPVAPTQIPGIGNLPGLGGAQSLRLEAYYRPITRLRVTGGVELADLNSERPDLSRQQTLRFSAAYSFTQALALSVRAAHISTSQPNFIVGEAQLKQNLFQIELSRAF